MGVHLFFFNKGAGGIGKTTEMKHVGLSWADGSSDILSNFYFVFHVSLKDVKADQSIEKIIVDQHSLISGNNVELGEVKSILQAHKNLDILFLFDGYDEYTPGTNSDIDKILTKYYLRNCWVILTSRETKEFHKVRDYLDAEAEITGFGPESVKEYLTRNLGSKEKQIELITISRQRGILTSQHQDSDTGSSDATKYDEGGLDYGLLCVPFLLNMICCLFVSERGSLPRTKTGIISAIVERCPDWEEIRKRGQKGVKDVHSALLRLGKLVWDKMQKENFNQTFNRVCNL